MAERPADPSHRKSRGAGILGLATAFAVGAASALIATAKPPAARRYNEIPQAKVYDRYAPDEGDLVVANYETEDLTPRVVAILAGVVVAALVVVFLLILLLYPRARHDQAVEGEYRLQAMQTPRLQANPRADMAAFYRSEVAQLNGYGWADRQKDVVHIPIAQAMSDVAREGVPGWPVPARSAPK